MNRVMMSCRGRVGLAVICSFVDVFVGWEGGGRGCLFACRFWTVEFWVLGGFGDGTTAGWMVEFCMNAWDTK
ncbi:hypothetical protein F5144DRAFT_564045 [Chaetomium tenue]|uniref:Uncharacterized protein n=1 Tax=Chaetomium tenue TaxID=1854479 RepID=A0ACB7PIE1_9PEZI|nr:hypothetical protein F5144DRAFT_564045 [Chaetomium globosum]